MKALILAAGFGTRLRPHTDHIPKPLFPIDGSPLIERTIQRLIDSGVTGIIVNVHHLHRQINDYIQRREYPIPVATRYETEILGTGGAIKNVADFLGDRPFLVINSDIVTDIDISAVYEFHCRHSHPVTLVMHDYPVFNNVWVDGHGHVIAFSPTDKEMPPEVCRRAFTGIQVIDPVIMDFIDAKSFVSSIDVFREMIDQGHIINAYTAENHYWLDIGTPESFSRAVYDGIMPKAFKKAWGEYFSDSVKHTLLAGDGSDRRWYRIISGINSLILGDHGLHPPDPVAEVDAFIHIGKHLFNHHIPVPEIYYADRFSGQVYLQDLGDTNLQTMICNMSDDEKIIRTYQQVIDQALAMSVAGARSFDTAWTYQSPTYDRHLILEKECRYFVDALLNTYLETGILYEDLETEFELLADRVLANALTGFMHRDLQSRNIMIADNKIFFIDFQGGRLGPIQYDLASLLTDPYVNLPEPVQETLLDYSVYQLEKHVPFDREKFTAGYRYCSITRILQSLGAFGFLTRVKQKPFFEQFIPIALNNLNTRLKSGEVEPFPLLTEVVEKALMALNTNLSNP